MVECFDSWAAMRALRSQYEHVTFRVAKLTWTLLQESSLASKRSVAEMAEAHCWHYLSHLAVVEDSDTYGYSQQWLRSSAVSGAARAVHSTHNFDK